MEKHIDLGTHNISMTLKISAKGEIYGEYTCKAQTPEELDQLLTQCKGIYLKHKGM